MKIAFLLLLIGNIITDSSNINIFDITFDKEFIVDVSKFPENYIPSTTSSYFRVKVEQSGSVQLKVNFLKKSIVIYRLDICGFKDRPSDEEVLNGNSGCINNLEKLLKYSDDNYDSYISDFEIKEDVKYLTIHLKSIIAIDYLSVTISNQPF